MIFPPAVALDSSLTTWAVTQSAPALCDRVGDGLGEGFGLCEPVGEGFGLLDFVGLLDGFGVLDGLLLGLLLGLGLLDGLGLCELLGLLDELALPDGLGVFDGLALGLFEGLLDGLLDGLGFLAAPVFVSRVADTAEVEPPAQGECTVWTWAASTGATEKPETRNPAPAAATTIRPARRMPIGTAVPRQSSCLGRAPAC